MLSTSTFADFRGLKEKLASKRSSSRTRSASKPQELEIGSPVLISTTVDDLNLIPLPSYRPAPTSAPFNAPANAKPASRSLPSIRKEFSPLGSHPIDPVRDPLFQVTDRATVNGKPPLKRARSHVPSTIVTSEFKLEKNRTRANSADTRRTQHYLFSNDPWLATPKAQEIFELEAHVPSEQLPPVLTLQRPSISIAPSSASERPTSSHRTMRSPNLRQTPLDKELPELPRYLTPAPLFACNNLSPVEISEESLNEEERSEVEVEDEDDEILSDLITQYQDKPQSHFSTWSSESMGYSYATSDDDATHSPTFSSLTSNCSEADSPQRLSHRYSDVEPRSHRMTMLEQAVKVQEEETVAECVSTTPPRLDDLHISTFGPDLFNLDIQHADAAPRRQAACFGLGVQYSLPGDISTSGKDTISGSALRIEPNVQRESSLSQLNGLIDDFAYLGDAVI
jgi:hypothetical protein